MLPCVIPLPVTDNVTDGIIGEGSAVIDRQQIAPFRITVGIVLHIHLILYQHCSGGIEIGPAVFDIAALIICPGVGIACSRVIFPNQLVGGIIFIGRGIGSVADGENIAIIIVCVGIGNIVAGCPVAHGTDLPGCLCTGAVKAIGGGKYCGILKGNSFCAVSSIGVIAVGLLCPALLGREQPVITIIGMPNVAGVAIGIFYGVGNAIKAINGMGNRGAVIIAALSLFNELTLQIIEIGGLFSGSGIRHRYQVPIGIIAIGDCSAVLVCQLCDATLSIVGVLHIIPVAVGEFI